MMVRVTLTHITVGGRVVTSTFHTQAWRAYTLIGARSISGWRGTITVEDI